MMLRPGQAIALCVLALLMFGVVMVNSAGMSVDPRRAVTIESILLSRSMVYMGLAVAAMLAVGLMPVRRLATVVDRPHAEGGATEAEKNGLNGWLTGIRGLWPMWLAVAGLVGALACVYLPGIGREVNNSHRWINLHVAGLDSIQPSELAKWGLIGVIAWYGCRNAKRMSSFWHGLLPGLAAAGVVSVVIVKEDLGTGALVGLVAVMVLVAAGARIWHLALLAPIPLAGIVLAIITNPYRVHRITSFLNPYEDAQGKGYHMIQSMVAVANGQFFGTGMGHGLQKFDYLPEDTTDFLFAIVCEELGVFGAALVIFLYVALLWSILSVIKREPSRFLRLVALGVMATVGLQAVINLAVVTGLGPTKGIALPLMSSGGTGWILTAASLGLVIAMDRSQGAMQWYQVAATRPEGPEEAVPPMIEPATEPVGGMKPAADDRFAPPATAIAAEGVLAAVREESDAGREEELQPVEAGVALAEDEPDASGAPVGETGLLFASAERVEKSLEASPRIVVTDEGREWPERARLSPA